MGTVKMKTLLVTEEAWRKLSFEKKMLGFGKAESFSETIIRLIDERTEAAKR